MESETRYYSQNSCSLNRSVRKNTYSTRGLVTMPLKIIVVGDSTDHGGKVISGSPLHDVDGKPIARLGDQVDCPQHYPGGKPHGINKIVTAHATVSVGGIAVAVEGCVTECGCKLIGSHRASVD